MHTTGATFQVNNAKLYVPIVTLSINDNIKFIEHIKQVIKKTNSRIICKSEITTQPKNNNLAYLIDPTFRNINRLFVLPIKNGNDDPTIDYFDKYYIPLVEIKDFNTLINNKPFFDQPVKNKQEAYEKLTKISRNNDYTTRNLLDYLHHKQYYKIMPIELSRQRNTIIIYNTEFLKSNLCDYNDAYILVKGEIIVTAAPVTGTTFKNCAPFTKCITKIDGTTNTYC